MFKHLALSLLLAAGLARAAVPSVSLPLDWTTANGISRANLNLNPIALRDGLNVAIDSLNPVLAAFTGWNASLAIASNQDLILKVDADANGTHKLVVTANNVDSILRIHEDGTARIFDHLAVDSNITTRKVSAADSVVGAHLKTASGNLIVGGTGAVTGALSSGAFSATTGSFSSTLGVTGLSTLSGGALFNTNASTAQGKINYASVEGLLIRGITGSSNDFTLYSADAGTLIGNPTGTRNLTIGHSSGTTTFPGAMVAAGITSSGDASVSKSTAGATSIVSAVQSDNTNSASNARLQATVGGASGGDPFVRFTITGATDWVVGPDNSDGDALVITPSTTPGGATNGLRISTAGAVTAPGTLGVTGVTTATGGLTLGARFIDMTTTVTSGSTSLGTAHSTIFANGTSGTVTLNLPAASGNAGLIYTVYDIDATTNAVTLDGNASETIGGATTVVLGGNTGNGRIVIICDGSNWKIREWYDEGTFTATLTGVDATVTGTARWAKSGKVVSLSLPSNLTGTSNSTACTVTGLPSVIVPTTTNPVVAEYIMDNGSRYPGIASIGSSVTLYIRTDFTTSPASNSFTASGTKGLGAFFPTLTYSLL